MFEDSLFEPLVKVQKESPVEVDTTTLYTNFISQLEGWKTRCKNLHWAAHNRSIHKYLDDFLSILSEYQDSLAEEVMGISGKFSPVAIKGLECSCTDANTFIIEVREKTLEFYNNIPDIPMNKGIKSECETFIHNINKYKYLFSLCGVNIMSLV